MNLFDSYYRVTLTFDSVDDTRAQMAKRDLQSLISGGIYLLNCYPHSTDSLIPFDTDPLHDCVAKFDAYLNTLRSEPSSGRYLSNVESADKLINDILSEYE